MRKTITILACLMLAWNGGSDTVAELRPVIKEAAAQHGVDPVLIEAIIRHESANATSSAARRKNNLAGIMGRRGQRAYESKEECVRDLARLLDRYRSRGRVTVAQIGRIYCQNGSPWARHINAYMAQIRDGRWGSLD